MYRMCPIRPQSFFLLLCLRCVPRLIEEEEEEEEREKRSLVEDVTIGEVRGEEEEEEEDQRTRSAREGAKAGQ